MDDMEQMYVNETQFLLQYYDMGIIHKNNVLQRLKFLLPKLNDEDRLAVVKQCDDKMIYLDEISGAS